MTSQQLLAARAALWRQNAEPILTLEDATQWVEAQGFLLFLPRRQQLPAPAPSLVEACLGKLENTPARSVIEDALSIARRMFETDEVIPLNLFGTLSEEPDFLITREMLPLLLSLRADRNWKTVPAGRTSPLHVNVWKLLDEQGALTSEQLRSAIGREVTDAAIRRALVELWSTLRVVPRYRDDETEWKLMKAAFPKESARGATASQNSALSLFIASYLRSTVAASEDEVTAYLSPVASRAKVREALNGLLATRQLGAIALGPKTVYHVAGELPEFPEIVVEVAPAIALEGEELLAAELGLSPEAESQTEGQADGERIRKYTPSEGAFSQDRGGSSRPERPSYGSRERSGFGDRERSGRGPQSDRRPYDRKPYDRSGGRNDRGTGGFRPAFGRREDRGFSRENAPTSSGAFGNEPRSREESGSNSGRGDRPSFDRPKFDRPRYDRPAGDRPQFDRPRRDDGERRSFGGGDRRPSFGGGDRRPSFGGDRKPSFGGGDRRPSFGGDRKPSFGGGDRRPSFGGDRKPSFGGGDRRPSFGGDRKPSFGGGDRRPSFGGDRKPSFGGGDRRPSFGGDRKPSFGGGDRRPSFGGDRRPSFGGGDRRPSFGGDRKPSFGGGDRRPSFGGDRKPSFGGGDRPEGGERRSFGSGDRKPSFGARGGKPGFGARGAGRPSGGGFGARAGKPFGKGPGSRFGKGPGKGGPSRGGAGKSFGRGPARGPEAPKRRSDEE